MSAATLVTWSRPALYSLFPKMPEKRSCILHWSKSWTTDNNKRPLVFWYYVFCNVVLGIAYCGITYCGILYCILWSVAGFAWLMFASVRKRSPRAKYTTIHSRVQNTLRHAPQYEIHYHVIKNQTDSTEYAPIQQNANAHSNQHWPITSISPLPNSSKYIWNALQCKV